MKNISVYKTLYTLSYILLMASDMFSNFKPLLKYLGLLSDIGIILLIIVFLIKSKKYKKIELLLVLLFSFTVLFLTLNNIYKNIIYIFLLIVSMKDIQFDSFIKNVFIFRIIFCLIIVCGHYLGLTNDLIMYRTGNIVRNSMGFAHPNRFGACLLELCAEYVYIRNKNIKFYDLFIIIFFALIMNHFVDSRASLISMISLIIMCFILIIKKEKVFDNSIFKKIIIILPIIFTFFSLFISKLYVKGNYDVILIDKMLTGRIRIMSYNIINIGFSLFGRNMSIVPDNVYIQILIRYGIIFTILFFLLYCRLIKKSYKDKNYYLLVILILYCVYGLIESYLIRITYNAFLILIGTVIYYREEKKNSE